MGPRNRRNVVRVAPVAAPPVFPVLSLPQDIFFVIASLLPKRDLKILMLSCRQFHTVVTQHLYTDISLTGFIARTFFVSLAGRSLRSQMYASTVQRLSYALGDDDPLLSFPMLCVALVHTVRLTTLAISIPPQDTDLLKTYMVKAGFYKVATSVRWDITTAHQPSSCVDLVPELDSFSIAGAIDLLEMVEHRHLRAVSLTQPMGYKQLDYLFDSLSDHGRPPCLEDLRLCIRKHVDLKAVLLVIGATFPTILMLSVEQPEMNPMMVLRTLAEHHDTLPSLRHLFLNLQSQVVPPYASSSLDSIQYQLHLLDIISTKRPHLLFVRVGPCLWRFSVTGTGWTPMPTPQTIEWWCTTFSSKTIISNTSQVAQLMLLNWGI